MPNNELMPAKTPLKAPGRGGGMVRTEGGREFTIPADQPNQQPGQEFQLPSQLQNRNQYEQFLQSKYGDPWEDERNLDNIINDTASQNEREAFEHVFGGQYRYEDRGRLSKKAQDYWQNSLLKLRKNIENQHKQDIGVRKEQMGEQMKVFDNYVKMMKPEKPAKSRYGVKTVLDMVEKINNEKRPPTDNERIAIDEMTKDMPVEVQMKVTQEAKKRGFLGIDILMPDIKEKSHIALTPKSDSKEKPPMEGAKKAQDGNWYIQKDGKFYMVN